LQHLNLAQPLDLIPWLYSENRTRDVAALARIVLDHAETDPLARELVEEAADELALALRAVQVRLHAFDLPVAFAGSLLSAPNPLSTRVLARLGLPSIPVPQFPPVIGAAILASNVGLE
jgi:N-acetylglucosamine kinase-like BadF-type ATPase